MAVTAEEIAALRKAIATGARTVQVGASSITYRSLSDMKEALAFAEGDAGIGPPVERVFRPICSSGL